MKLPFQDIIAGRILPDILAFFRSFAESARSGAFRRDLRRWWSANGIFAVISLAVAALLYFRIRENVNHNGFRSVPVDVTIEGADRFSSVAVSPRAIDVYVRGTENDVRKFESDGAPIRIALPYDAKLTGDGIRFRVRPRKDIPGIRELGLLVTRQSSDFVTVTSDRASDVQFDIDPPKLIGKAYHADATVEITPMSASLHGGQNLLESLKDSVHLQVKPIEIENVSQSFERDCEIVLPEQLAPVVTVYPRSVHAHVKIVPRAGTRTFDSIPMRLSVPPGTPIPPGCDLWPAEVAAKITGYDLSVAALSNSMITAYAEIAASLSLDYSPGATNILPVRLEFPPDKEIWRAEADPKVVSLIMPAAPATTEEPTTPEVVGEDAGAVADQDGDDAAEHVGDGDAEPEAQGEVAPPEKEDEEQQEQE
ncbi:MAG: hypothetical protein IJT64_00335 [Kiritimatiellae bacterium]|nr:hypothetical protein [Kiritimatiellia bacterium]